MRPVRQRRCDSPYFQVDVAGIEEQIRYKQEQKELEKQKELAMGTRLLLFLCNLRADCTLQ